MPPTQRRGNVLFLSTLSLRRATRRGVTCYLDNIISIHALLAESDLINTYHRIFGEGISIHALLAESDRKAFSIFLPIRISIHALLAESD